MEVTIKGVTYIECDCCHTYQSADINDFQDVMVGDPDDQGMCESVKWCNDCIAWSQAEL